MPAVKWANSLAEYVELCDRDPQSITLLDPHDPIRRERWIQVICWHASCSGYSQPDAKPQSDGLIISLDDGAETDVIASVLAKRLGRAHNYLKTIEELPNQSGLPVIIVARREALDLATLGRLHRKLESIGSSMGVLTATDLPGLSFVAAKCWLAPSIPPFDDFIVDAVYGEGESLNDLTNHADGWRLALLMAHGEGAHLYLGSGVLCGLMGTHEMIDDSRVPDGCGVEDCKRARKAQLATIPANSLRCRIMALLSCNSFSVARELYPSNSSLVLAAADGWPAAVIANPTSMEFSPVHSRFLQHLLNQGTLLGDAVATLNRTLRVSPDYPPYILLGDPLCRVAPPIAAEDNEQRPLEPTTQSVHIVPRDNESAYDLAPWTQDGSLVGRSAVFLLNDSCRPSSPTISNKTPDLDRLEALVEVLGQRLINVNNWLSILISLGSEDAFDLLLADLRVSTARIQYSLAALAQVVSNIHQLSVWDPSVNELQDNLHEAISAWDAGFALMIHDHLLGGGEPVGDKVIELLTRTHFLETQSQGSACPRCSTATSNNMYRCLVTASQSQLQDCTLCGPLSAAPSTNVRLDVEVKGCVRLDESFAARVNLTGSKEPGFLVIEFRDKSHPGAKLRTIESWPGDTPSQLLPLSLADSGCDQHSIRAVWVGGLEWVYARRVLSVIPSLT